MCATELKGILLISEHLDAVNDFGVWLVFISCMFEKTFLHGEFSTSDSEE